MIETKHSPSAQIPVTRFYNGAIFEDHSIVVTSDGAVVTLSLEEAGGGDLNLFFDGKLTAFDSTPAATITLTAGSDEAPTENWVYIPKSTGVLTINTVGFPTNEQFIPIARAIVPTAATTQTDGCYKCHAYTDHLSNSVGQGHLSHLNDWVRDQPATYISGGIGATTITTNGGAIDNIDFANASALIKQLHIHTFPALDTATGSSVWVHNDFTTKNNKITDIGDINLTSDGATLRSNNTYYNIVIWGVASENQADSKLFANVPSGTYSNSSDALTDPNKYANKTIPTEYRGTGFLIANIVLRYQTSGSGTFTEIDTLSLLGSTEGGGAVGVSKWSHLIDTPSSYVGFAGNSPRVNQAETALELSGAFFGAIRTETNDYTIVATDYSVLADATSNTVDISLPASPTQGQIFNVFCINSTFTCTIVRNGNNINGAASDQALLVTESATLQFDATYGWLIL